MMDHLTIFKKGLVVLSVPLLVQLYFAWRVTPTQGDVQQAQARSARTKEVLATTQDLMHSLADTEADMRGYLVSRHSSFVEPYFKASREVAAHLNGLRDLVAEDPAREVARFRQQEERRDRELTDSLGDSLKQQQGLVLAGALAAFVITASLASVLYRGVSHRMARLTGEVRRLNEGRPSAAPILLPAPAADEFIEAIRRLGLFLAIVQAPREDDRT